MKYKSRAIALTYTKYGESSIISTIFTEEKGLQTFIIKSVRSKKAKIPLIYFEPLKFLTIDGNFNPKQSLQYLEDVSIIGHHIMGQKNMYKIFISAFVA